MYSNIQYQQVLALVNFWRTRTFWRYFDAKTLDVKTLEPPPKMRVWAKISCRRRALAKTLEDSLVLALDENDYDVTVLFPAPNDVITLRIPKEYVRKHVMVSGYDSDRIEYDELHDAVVVYTYDVFLSREELA